MSFSVTHRVYQISLVFTDVFMSNNIILLAIVSVTVQLKSDYFDVFISGSVFIRKGRIDYYQK